MIAFIERHSLYSVDVDGCACGMTDSHGDPVLKKWKFITSSERQAHSLAGLRCSHPKEFRHAEIFGSTTKGTEKYPAALCHTLLSVLFGHWNHVPAMPCIEVEDFGHLAPGEPNSFGATPMSRLPKGSSIPWVLYPIF